MTDEASARVNRTNFLRELLASGHGSAVGLQSELVLLRSRHAEFTRKYFSRLAHVQTTDRVGQTKLQSHARCKVRRTKSSDGAQLLAERLCLRQRSKFYRGRLPEQQRNLRHTFRAANDKHRTAARDHLFVSLRERLTTRRAVAVNCDRWNMLRNPATKSDDTRHVGGIDRLAHTTENHFIDPARIEAGAGKQCVDGNTTQFVSSQLRKVGAHFGERRANSVNDDKSFGFHLSASIVSAERASGSGGASPVSRARRGDCSALRLSTIFCSLSCTPTPCSSRMASSS